MRSAYSISLPGARRRGTARRGTKAVELCRSCGSSEAAVADEALITVEDFWKLDGRTRTDVRLRPCIEVPICVFRVADVFASAPRAHRRSRMMNSSAGGLYRLLNFSAVTAASPNTRGLFGLNPIHGRS